MSLVGDAVKDLRRLYPRRDFAAARLGELAASLTTAAGDLDTAIGALSAGTIDQPTIDDLVAKSAAVVALEVALNG